MPMLARGHRAGQPRAAAAGRAAAGWSSPRRCCPLPALEMLIAEMLAIHFCSDRDRDASRCCEDLLARCGGACAGAGRAAARCGARCSG